MPFWSSQQPQPSYIDVDFRFATINGTTPQSAGAQLEVVIFRAVHGQAEYTFRYKTDDGDTVSTSCCAHIRDKVVDERSCPTDSSLYINFDYAHAVERYVVKFDADSTAAAVQRRYEVKETGEHFLIIADCSPLGFGSTPVFSTGVSVDGRTVWMNPYGHLMGRLYGYLPFYAIMAAVFAIASLVWYSYYVWHWSSIAPIQHCVSVVLSLCLLESAVWLVGYWQWNDSGSRSVALIVAAILLTVTSSHAVSHAGGGRIAWLGCGASFAWQQHVEAARAGRAVLCVRGQSGAGAALQSNGRGR